MSGGALLARRVTLPCLHRERSPFAQFQRTIVLPDLVTAPADVDAIAALAAKSDPTQALTDALAAFLAVAFGAP